MTITTKHLFETAIKLNSNHSQEDIKIESFKIGDFVSDGNFTGEIIYKGSNYVTIVSEGFEQKCWLSAIYKAEGELKRDQLYKESFIFKGYKSKNLTRELSEQFKTISKENTDAYALLSCIKSCDYIMGVDSEKVSSNFNEVRIQLERARRYSKKFLINISEHLYSVEEDCLRFSILENINFATTDRMMIAKMIAAVSEVDASGVDPTAIINKAVITLRLAHLTSPGWQLVGRMLNVATKAGIKWTKSVFSQSQLTIMGIK